MNNKILKIVYISKDNSKDMRSWSGLTYFISDSLRLHGAELIFIDNILINNYLFIKIIDKIYSILIKIFSGKIYQNNRTIRLSKKYANIINKKIPMDADAILIPSGTIQMAFLNTDKKKILYNDATFASMINFYPAFTNLCKKTIYEGNLIDKKAFENSDILIFSSDWAANSAINDYNINPSKVKVIPFGANILKSYSDKEISDIIENRCNNINTKCNFLFIGVDWERKGGNIALDIINLLHSKNINLHFDIVGIKNLSLELPYYVTNHGFLNKSIEEEKNKIDNLYINANFLLFPTRFECSAIVFSEASSFGLPAITTKTGGTETIIKDNLNGMTFNLNANIDEYVNYILKTIENKDNYKKLCQSSYNEYITRLNWNVSGKKIIDSIEQLF